MYNKVFHKQQWRIQDFPGGGPPTPKVGTRTYFFGRKQHENERILAPGGHASLAPPLDPPLNKNVDSANFILTVS